MSVSLCIRAKRFDAETIARTLLTLVDLNVELYRSREVTTAPWSLVWIPDEPANVSTLHDAALLEERGYGSCGELACAYAGWLVVYHKGSGNLQLLSNGPDAWHVTATRGRVVYDPQILGARRYAALA